MKNLIYLLFIPTLFFCSNNINDENLKIEIINTQILSRINIDSNNIGNAVLYSQYIYDSIPVNKINLKITNIGKKKYVLFLKKDFDEIENLDSENIKFTVFKDTKIFPPTYLPFTVALTNKGFKMRNFLNEVERDSLKQELNKKYLKEKIDNEKIRFQQNMNYVVIHPGETKFFSYYKTLPVFLEKISDYYTYKFDKAEKYYFQISLNNNAQSLKKYLTINQFKEIETNGYTIFDGVIESNKIPIKFIDM